MKLSKTRPSWLWGQDKTVASERHEPSKPNAPVVKNAEKTASKDMKTTIKTTTQNDPIYTLLAPYFDSDFYLAMNPDVQKAGLDPLEHYMKHGSQEGRKPSPEFDPKFYAKRYASELGNKSALQHYILEGKDAGNSPSSNMFDYDWYKKVYLDEKATSADCEKHYAEKNQYDLLCKTGDDIFIELRKEFDAKYYLEIYPGIKDLDPWMHYVGAGRSESRKIARWYRPGIGNIQKQVDVIIRDAWDLKGIDVALDRLEISALDTLTSGTPTHLSDINKALKNAFIDIGSEISSLVATGTLGIGGAELYGINLFRTLSKLHGSQETLLLVTDGARGKGEKWLPDDAQTLVVSDYLPNASGEDRAQFTRRLISILQPQTTYCVNSRALWDVMIKPKSAIRHFTSLRACLFCYDYTAEGATVGYAATEFAQAFTLIDHFLIDNQTFLDQLVHDFSIPETHKSKLRVLRTPVNAKALRAVADAPHRRVFWTGRMSRQKLPEIISGIAALCPGISFHLYSVPGDINIESLGLPANVKLEPPYDPDVGVPFEKYGAFLYTSLWDGIPTALLDAAAAGIPVIGSASGGISEILDSETGWPIHNLYDPRQYAHSLQEACFTPNEAHRRTQAMAQRLNSNHSWKEFERIVKLVDQRQEPKP